MARATNGQLESACKLAGLHAASYALGDGVRRFKFFDRPASYFEGGELFRCNGIKAAVAFAESRVAVRDAERRASNAVGETLSALAHYPRILVFDPQIRAFLEAHDPATLAGAERALGGPAATQAARVLPEETQE